MSSELDVVRRQLNLDELLSVYPEEAVNKLIANKDKLNKIAGIFTNTIGAISVGAVIMKCNPAKCPFKSSCVLLANDMAPDGYSCPIEKKIAMTLESSVIEDLEIDVQNTMEMELLYDLIDIKILDLRSSGMLADSSIIQVIEMQSKIGSSTHKEVAPEFEVKIELKKLKFAIMEEFMATRKAKKKYGVNTGENSIESMIRAAMMQQQIKPK